MPPQIAESPADWRQLYPFNSHWMELDGGRLHYVDVGPQRGRDAFSTGGADSITNSPVEKAFRPRALLFVHGNPTWSFHWRRLILALRDRYRCVAVDHLGCGLSDKPSRFLSLANHIENLATFVRRLQLDGTNVTLIAQDWGGAIGLGAMLSARERLERIVLFNSGAFPPRYIPWRIRACRLPVLGKLAVQGGNLFSRAALRMTLARRQRLDPAVAAGYLSPYNTWANRRAVYGFVKDIPPGPSHPTWQTLAEIEKNLPSLATVPSSLIWGMRDWCFRPDCLERFQAAWPHVEVHRLADVGHWVVEDAPEEALAIVERFVAANVAGTLRVPQPNSGVAAT